MDENENIINEENIKDDETLANNQSSNSEDIEDSEASNKEPKKIEVITGNGELNISPVSRYIEVEKPRPKEDKKIIVPEVKESISRKDENKEA